MVFKMAHHMKILDMTKGSSLSLLHSAFLNNRIPRCPLSHIFSIIHIIVQQSSKECWVFSYYIQAVLAPHKILWRQSGKKKKGINLNNIHFFLIKLHVSVNPNCFLGKLHMHHCAVCRRNCQTLIQFIKCLKIRKANKQL